jgi:GxxExxY protein
MAELLHKDEVYAIVGAAMEVYNQLGCGFLEAVYQEALEIELASRGIAYISQPQLEIAYKGQVLRKTYIPDLVACGKVIVEIKAIELLTSREISQLINELKCSTFEVGLLLNFGHPKKLEWERRVLTKPPKD